MAFPQSGRFLTKLGGCECESQLTAASVISVLPVVNLRCMLLFPAFFVAATCSFLNESGLSRKGLVVGWTS